MVKPPLAVLEGGKGQRVTDDPVCRVDAFKLATRLRARAWIDLSRGDPLDPPSARAQAVHTLFSYFTQQALECAEPWGSVRDIPAGDLVSLWERTLAAAWASGRARADAITVLGAVRDKVRQLSGCSESDALAVTLRRLATEFSGSRYGDPSGQEHLRAIVAELVPRLIAPVRGKQVPVLDGDNVILTNGASEGIEATSRLLVARCLMPGDVVGMVAPIYSPYLEIAREKGLVVVPLATSAENGWEPTDRDLATFDEAVRRRRGALKAFILVNPGNPSGVALRQERVAALAALLRTHDRCVVIEDMVYAPFLPRGTFHSLWAHLPDRTILLHSLSKIERVTGGRIGFLFVTDEASVTLGRLLNSGHEIGAESVYGGAVGDFRTLLALTKGGKLSHTHQMPGPMQWDAIIRLVMNDGGEAFAEVLQRRWTAFYHGLGLRTPGEDAGGTRQIRYVPYYCLLDAAELVRTLAAEDPTYDTLVQAMEGGKLSPWELFSQFARDGVAILPSARFFPDPGANRWMFRVSVANETMPRVQAAAGLIRASVENLARACRDKCAA